MFQSSHITTRLNQLQTFLNRIAKQIIISPSVEQKTFKMRQNFIPYYTLVYDLCNEKPPLHQKMLQQFKSSLSNFIQSYITMSQEVKPWKFSIQNSTQIISWFNSLWTRYVKFMICISKKVFSYLDRHYLPGTQQSSLYKVGIKLFNKNVCHQHNMRFFQNCYFKQLRQIRIKKLIQNNELLKFSQAIAIIDYPDMIGNLTKLFVDQTISHYQSFYQENCNLPSIQYYNKVLNMYLFEQVLIKMSICLNFFQISHIFLQFSNILVKQYTETFVSSQSGSHGLKKMFETKNIEFMKIINEIYRRFQGFDKIKEAYYDFVLEKSQQVLQKYKTSMNQQQSLKMIDEIYEFYKSNLSIITLGFKKRNQLFVTLNNAIQKIISKQQRFSSTLYFYCSKARRQNTFAQNKQKITLLFDKILSKDQFVSLYQNELFKKIASSQIDIKAEQEFVLYLNQICGSDLTHKLIKKIKDVVEAPKNQELMYLLPQNINFMISVLSLHLWQKKFADQLTLNISLPQPLQSLWRGIERNFIEKQPKKKLIPLPFENKLTLQIKFNKKVFLMKCNLIQAAIFMFLASKSYTSQEQLILNLSIQKNVVHSMMQTFQQIPHLILKTTLGDYIVNWYFDQSDSTIDLVSKTQQSNKQMQKAIKQDREILIEAAIVKFIKRSKHATFEQIVAGVIKAIRLFKPQPPIIKASVDKLLKKGFLQQTQGGILEYVE